MLSFLVTTIATQAQTVTHQQIQGKWKMFYFSDENGSANVETHTVTINEKTTEPKEEVDILYEDIMNQAEDAVFTVKEDVVVNIVQDEEYKFAYKLENKDGNSYMIMEQNLDNQGNPRVFVVDGLLHLAYDSRKLDVVYKRIKE